MLIYSIMTVTFFSRQRDVNKKKFPIILPTRRLMSTLSFCRSLYSLYVSSSCSRSATTSSRSTVHTIGNAYCSGTTSASLASCTCTAGAPTTTRLGALKSAPPPVLRSLFLVSKGGSAAPSHAPGGSGLRPGLFSCLLRPHESGSVKDLQQSTIILVRCLTKPRPHHRRLPQQPRPLARPEVAQQQCRPRVVAQVSSLEIPEAE